MHLSFPTPTIIGMKWEKVLEERGNLLYIPGVWGGGRGVKELKRKGEGRSLVDLSQCSGVSCHRELPKRHP